MVCLEGGAVAHLEDLKGGTLRLDGVPEPCSGLPWTHAGLVENIHTHRADPAVPLLCDGLDGVRSTAVLDWLSQLRLGGPALVVDYDQPPALDADRAAAVNLLG
jgi:hypothetical protein